MKSRIDQGFISPNLECCVHRIAFHAGLQPSSGVENGLPGGSSIEIAILVKNTQRKSCSVAGKKVP